MPRRKAEGTTTEAPAKPKPKGFTLQRSPTLLTREQIIAARQELAALRTQEFQYMAIAREYGCKR